MTILIYYTCDSDKALFMNIGSKYSGKHCDPDVHGVLGEPGSQYPVKISSAKHDKMG